MPEEKVTALTVKDSDHLPYFNEEEEHAICNMVPPKIAEHLSRVPAEWLELPEIELKKTCYPEQWSPTLEGKLASHFDQDTQLRYSFWLEYDLAVSKGRKMVMGNVFRDICDAKYFQNCVVQNPKRAAWILKPPGNYSAKIQALMWMGQQARFNILTLPIVYQICGCKKRCPHGFKVLQKYENHCEFCPCREKCGCPPTVDVRLADLQETIAQAVELRAKGSIPIKQMNLNLNRTESQPKESDEKPAQPKDLEAEIERIRGEIEKIGGTGQEPLQNDIIDVTPDKP